MKKYNPSTFHQIPPVYIYHIPYRGAGINHYCLTTLKTSYFTI